MTNPDCTTTSGQEIASFHMCEAWPYELILTLNPKQSLPGQLRQQLLPLAGVAADFLDLQHYRIGLAQQRSGYRGIPKRIRSGIRYVTPVDDRDADDILLHVNPYFVTPEQLIAKWPSIVDTICAIQGEEQPGRPDNWPFPTWAGKCEAEADHV